MPPIGKNAQKIKLTGLQIINGAQTVYSIYRAYKNASPTKRMQMDTESLVTLRLLKSGGKDFDLNVTRYTNSQNPVQDRDFCANDDIQIKLQNASYKTPVWYEKRRGEFREVPEKITKVPNYIFANVYLAYHLQEPVSVLSNYKKETQINDKDLNFISHREHKDGLYEKIFNDETQFKDMLSAFYISDTIFKTTSLSYSNSFTSSFYHLLALFKVVFTKYLQKKYKPDINVNNHIIRIYEKREIDIVIILKTFKFVYEFVIDKLEIADSNREAEGDIVKFFFEPFQYEKIKEELENMEISVNQIEDIILSNEDQQEAKEIYEKSDEE